MSSSMNKRPLPAQIGIVLALLSGGLLFLLPEPMGRELLAVIMTLIGAAYYGFAFSSQPMRIATIEVVTATGFVTLALLGLWVSPWFIVGGLILHGFWDLLHHNGQLARIPDWYIPFCLWYDWLFAALVAAWLWFL